MACSLGVNIINNGLTECGDEKCKFEYNYTGNSKCTVRNKNNYLEIKGCTNGYASFGGNELQVQDVRLYSPSLHRFNGSKTDAECIIQYSSFGGNNILVCMPVKKDDAASSSKKFFEFLNNAPQKGDVTDINMVGFTIGNILNTIPYYYYSGSFPYKTGNECSSRRNVKIIVFDPEKAGAANITESQLTKLRQLIDSTESNSLSEPTGEVMLLYNSGGATKPGEDTGKKFVTVADCQSINVPGKKRPSSTKRKPMDKAMWIVPLVLLGIFFLVVLIYMMYKGFTGASGRAARAGMSDAARAAARALDRNRAIGVLGVLFIIVIVLLILSLTNVIKT